MKRHDANQDNPDQHDPQPDARQSRHLPKDNPWRPLVESLDLFTPDFMDERNQPKQDQEREPL